MFRSAQSLRPRLFSARSQFRPAFAEHETRTAWLRFRKPAEYGTNDNRHNTVDWRILAHNHSQVV